MYILEHQNYYWDGVVWTKNKLKAKKFKSAKSAWKYVDQSSEDTMDISVVKV